MLARADVLCVKEGELDTGERRGRFGGLGVSENNFPATCWQEVMMLVGNLDRREAHIVGSHEGGHLLVTHGVGKMGEVLVLIVWSGVRVFFSVYSLLGLEESRTLPSSSNNSQVNSSSV